MSQDEPANKALMEVEANKSQTISSSSSSSSSDEDEGQFIRRPADYHTPEKTASDESSTSSSEEISSDVGTVAPTQTHKSARKRKTGRESRELERKLREIKIRYDRLLAQKAQQRNRTGGRKLKPERVTNPKSLAERIRGWQVSELEIHQEPGAQFHAWVTFKTTFQTNIKLYGIDDEDEKLMCLRAKGGRAITNILATVDKDELTFREAWSSLENQFSSPIDKGTETAKFYGMSQKQEEDIFTFFERVTKQARLCDFSQGDFAKNVGENFARKCLNPGYFLAAFDKFEDLDKLKCHARNFHLATPQQSKAEAVLAINNKPRDENFNKRQDYRDNTKRPRSESNANDQKSYKRSRMESPSHSGRDARGSRRECKYCGGSCDKGKCPAFGSKCGYCQKWNHYEQTCRSKKYDQGPSNKSINAVDGSKKQVNDDGWSS